jgi:putative redox protein
MTLYATARSIPDTLRQVVVIDGRHRLITDQPPHLGGEGSGPAPHELFPAALAGCVSSTLVVYARTKNWDLRHVTVDVDYDHRSTPRRFDIAVQMSGNLSDAQLERLKKVARACPLRRSIEAGIEFVEHFEASRPFGQHGFNCGVSWLIPVFLASASGRQRLAPIDEGKRGTCGLVGCEADGARALPVLPV